MLAYPSPKKTHIVPPGSKRTWCGRIASTVDTTEDSGTDSAYTDSTFCRKCNNTRAEHGYGPPTEEPDLPDLHHAAPAELLAFVRKVAMSAGAPKVLRVEAFALLVEWESAP